MPASSLLPYLANQVIAPVIQKGWFSGDSVRVGDYMRRAQFLYETGAVLGYAFRDKLLVLAELCGDPGREDETVRAFAESAAAQVAQSPGEPQDCYALFFKPEAERVMALLRQTGRTRQTAWSGFSRVVRKKLRRAEFSPGLIGAGWKGVAFGSQLPELTEKLLGTVPDAETWSLVQSGDTYSPASPLRPKPMARRQEEAVSMIRPYIEEVRPDLMARLGLWPEAASDYRLRMRALRARDPEQDP